MAVFQRISIHSFRDLFVLSILSMALSGCAMKQTHYKSFPELRDETSKNYSRQVLDSIVAVYDKGEMPVFFSVESGMSAWMPVYSGVLGSSISPLFMADKSSLNPSLTVGETMYSVLNYNDFGSAAMSRVTMLYGYLCFPINFGDVTLPHGSLFTIVDISDKPDGFLFSKQLKDGRYMGVPLSKDDEFIRFARDVTYWSKNMDPDPKDLVSTAGSLYRFSITYPEHLKVLANTIIGEKGGKAAIDPAQKALKEATDKFEALKKDALSSKANPMVLQTLLQMARDDMKEKEKAVAAVAGQLGTSTIAIGAKTSEMDLLIATLQSSLNKIQLCDPDLTQEKSDKIVQMFKDPIKQIMAGDELALNKHGNTLPVTSFLNAKEPMDELYRERFESLPMRMDTNILPGMQ